MERSVLILRYFLDLAVKLRGGCLIDLAGLLKMIGPDGLEDSEDTHCIDVCSELRGIERYLDVRLGGEVVDFCRLYLANQLDKGHRVTHVSIMQVEVRLTFEVGDSLAIVRG